MFNLEEITLIKIYASNRLSTIQNIEYASPYFEDEDAKKLAIRIVEKLKKITDEEFQNINLDLAIENFEEDDEEFIREEFKEFIFLRSDGVMEYFEKSNILSLIRERI